MSDTKQKILLKRTTEANKGPIPSGASHGELFLNIASGANVHNKIATMQIGTNKPIVWSDDVANEKKFATKTEVEAKNRITAEVLNKFNESAGFKADGSSSLENGKSLSEAITEIQNKEITGFVRDYNINEYGETAILINSEKDEPFFKVKLTKWEESDGSWEESDSSYGDFNTELELDSKGLNVNIEYFNNEENVWEQKCLSLNKNGLMLDNSSVVAVDEDNVLNKQEITIGNFEIKNDKPYNYRLEGEFVPYDWNGSPPYGEGYVKVVAEYNGEGAKLYSYSHNLGSNIPDGEQWFYEFIVTEALWKEEAAIWVEAPRYIGQRILILAAYLDSDYKVDGFEKLTFVNGQSETPIDTSADENDEHQIHNVIFTQYAQFSLKRTSKALLNGVPVATVDMFSDAVMVDEDNVSNKREITIGNFEIKYDKLYNYTLECHYGDRVEAIEASYDGEPARLATVYPYIDSEGKEIDWCYKFIVTSEYDDTIPNYVYIPSALIDGDYKSEYYSLLNFTEDVSETFSIYTSHDGEGLLSNAKITRSVPFSLKHTSKALLNGVPVATIDNVPEPISVDTKLNTTSKNPVQNKVITNKINELVKKNEEIESNFAELNEKVDSSKLILTTWSNLNSLKNTNKLIPGTKYRITDYVATSIIENTSCNTNSSFDIIVTAISENELDEVAITIAKDNANEEIYKIWYSLANDSERFAWADTTNGKGVIYRMIDKYNNDIPYDFRNILFRGRDVRAYTNGSLVSIYIDENNYYNTLCSITSSDGVNEGSGLGLFNNIKIESTFNTDGIQILNNILLISYAKKIISNIILGKGCYKNILVNCSNLHFDENCYNNYVVAYAGYYSDEISFGVGCHDNFMNGNCHDIKMGAGCSHNMFGYACNCITMEDKAVGNILGATDTYREKPTFGENSFYDVLLVEKEIEESDVIDLMNTLNIDIIAGSSIKYCTFKHQSRCNILGNGSQLVTLGMRSHHNIIGEYSTRITVGDVAYNNILFANGYTKSTDESGTVKWLSPSSVVSDIILESRVAYCQVGSKIVSNTPSGNIKIGQKSYNILIPAGSENVTVGSDVWYVKSDKPLKNVEIKDSNAEINFISNNDKIENVTLECSVYENKFSDEPSYVDINITQNNTHILPKNNSLSCGINTKINGDYAFAFGDSTSNANYSFSSGIGSAFGKGSVSFGGFYSRNYQTIVINNVSYELSSDKKYTIATCEYTHKGETNHVNKYPCVGNGLNGCIGYITEITEKAISKDGNGVFKFYIPTTDLTNNKPTNDKFVITNGTHYVSNCSIGEDSTTFGILNTAKGLASSTFGLGLQANNAYEFACGKYNLSSSNTVFSVGYGSDNKNRKNIFEVKTNNTAYINGTKVSVDGHKHSASDITSGTFDAARIPTGITVSESISASTADYALKVKDGAYFKGVVNEYPWLIGETYDIGDIVIYKSNSDLGTTSDDSLGSATSDDSFGDTSTAYIMTEEGWEELGSSMSQEIYAFKEDVEKTYLVGIKNGDGDSTIDTLKYSSKIYASNGNLYAESDETLKTHIDNVNGDPELIRQIPKVHYHWNDDESKEIQMGTYAQDLEKVYPELVATDKDGVKAVAYDKLSIVALAGIDKLYEMVQQLQTKNEELEKRIKELENK